jgi:hypothetical protein
MKIIYTEIEDVTIENIDNEKIAIAENILNQVGPLFEREIQEAEGDFKTLNDQKKQIEKALLQIKEKLQTLGIEFNRETKRKKLLNRIRQIIEVGLANDSSLRSEVIILLKVIDKMQDALLDEHIERMVATISKRFSKNLMPD